MMLRVRTGNIAANIDRPGVLVAAALEEYMVYISVMLSGGLRWHHRRGERRQYHGTTCDCKSSRGITQLRGKETYYASNATKIIVIQ